MTAAKHTPAPWVVDFDLSSLRVMTEDGKAICAMRRWLADQINFPDDIVRANARLISAAPELLEALDILVANLASDLECEGHNPEDDARVKLARAAIAKATGAAL